jgi:hypothetical protein
MVQIGYIMLSITCKHILVIFLHYFSIFIVIIVIIYYNIRSRGVYNVCILQAPFPTVTGKGHEKDRCGLSLNVIAKLSKNEQISMENLQKLCQFFNCQLHIPV